MAKGKIQALLYPKEAWTKKQARISASEIAKKQHAKILKIAESGNYIHVRLHRHAKGKPVRSFELGHGIIARYELKHLRRKKKSNPRRKNPDTQSFHWWMLIPPVAGVVLFYFFFGKPAQNGALISTANTLPQSLSQGSNLV